jgi:peptidoglycan/xylan/chitin deacetylase (PgdA/CDA1 family)
MKSRVVKFAKRVTRTVIGRPIFGRSILMYHRIAHADFDPWHLAVLPDEFERQLLALRGKAVLPLQEFARLQLANSLPRNAVAITFDDGYACNALVAAPMLQSFGYPATFFVVSQAIERPEEFWWDHLEFIFHSPQFDFETAASLLAKYSVKRQTRISNQQFAPPDNFLTLWDILRRLSAEMRRQYLGDLRDQLGIGKVTRPTHRPMTEAELLTLAANPLFEIGGHTATHPSLPSLDPSEQAEEIAFGSHFLQKLIGRPVRSFAYPFGEWEQATSSILGHAGYECAVTSMHRRVKPSDKKFELPRRHMVNRNAQTS